MDTEKLTIDSLRTAMAEEHYIAEDDIVIPLYLSLRLKKTSFDHRRRWRRENGNCQSIGFNFRYGFDSSPVL